ncbi:hypothetical protein [Bythopirellula polymerisocia]|uniref:Uncharacterized protein n=1 Tax=Bythopirellula polymerisocia TaxID=2528003 RepID=A0A5C6D4V0_9BACT|nr:hypothetical protein [Bythopirellula polymerisocia]TWU29899.1 hypothetical protein Pla144_06790 [Bythopirellula polymerisocia]
MNTIQEFVHLLPVPFNFVLLMLVIVFGTGIITSLFNQIRKFACYRQELDFKREMIDRGMSVEEVERLLQAKSPGQDCEID